MKDALNESESFLFCVREKILDFFFPRHCPACDRIVIKEEGLICKKCRNAFQYVGDTYCMKCGKPVREDGIVFCADCRKHRHFFVQNRACFQYHGMEQSIYRFKYKGRQEYGDYYGQEIAERLREYIEEINPDAIIPVPLHRSKFQHRGFNQAQRIADVIGDQFDVPVLPNFVIRSKKTQPQKDLSRSERQNNLKKAFKIAQNDVKLNTIIVVDDIYTTGSTIDMVSQVCLDAGIKKVYGICLAVGDGSS